MRINRIRLKNFCGVVETEVKFSPTGVTLIHGPNEAGKSTLMTGIDVLFDHRDDSKKEEVRETKPVNRDVGSEVEADVQIGEYEFTYFKRFHKEKETVLTVRAPKAESLVGREAHDRVIQILSGSVDTSLWRALRIMQGGKLEMPTLHDQRALAEALDRAAGEAKSGEKENALFEAAHSEYNQYYTDNGKEKDPVIGLSRKKATEAVGKEWDLQAEQNKLEEDVGRFATLEKTVATLKRGLAGLDNAQVKAQVAWEAVSKLAANVERTNSAKKLTDQALQVAKNALQQRNDMINLVNSTFQKVEAAKSQNTKITDALESAAETSNTARSERDSAIATASRCEVEERIRLEDLQLRDQDFELVLMQERLQHVNAADVAATAANTIVSTAKITEHRRTIIRNAEVKLITEKGIFNSASPQFTITALEAVEVVINDEPIKLGVGQDRKISVSKAVSAKIGSMATLLVEPGTNAETLSQSVTTAESALVKACAEAGVASPEEAETVWATFLEAKRTLLERDRVAKEHLRDLTREQLGEHIKAAKDKVDAYLAKRNADFDLPVTSEECKALLKLATKDASDAKTAQTKAEAVFAEVQEHHTKCREDHARIIATLQREQQDYDNLVGRLEGERARSSDDALGNSLAFAETEAQTAQESSRVAEEALKEADPESAKAMFESAVQAAKNARGQCDEEDRALLVLRTKLDLAGDAGLAESLAEAKRVTFEAEDSLARLLRRASATKLLYDTLSDERATMRRAYVAPLREGIERLGRHVFGGTLCVDVDEKLQVVSRTVDGITVPIKQLSTGAQEQIGVLVRLAAASMVSQDGGVPLVLDDALGSTDEGRLEAMGAVLRVASQGTQTIILTCSPERYIHVGAEVSAPMGR